MLNGSVGVLCVPRRDVRRPFYHDGAGRLHARKGLQLSSRATRISSNTRQNSIGLYVQDTWKATSRLTVSPGLRWEPHTLPYHLGHGRCTLKKSGSIRASRARSSRMPRPDFSTREMPLYPGFKIDVENSWLKFAPRLGLAWDVSGDGKTTVRSAYGLFYDLPPMFHWAGAGQARPGAIKSLSTIRREVWMNRGWAILGGNPFPTADQLRRCRSRKASST